MPLTSPWTGDSRRAALPSVSQNPPLFFRGGHGPPFPRYTPPLLHQDRENRIVIFFSAPQDSWICTILNRQPFLLLPSIPSLSSPDCTMALSIPGRADLIKDSPEQWGDCACHLPMGRLADHWHILTCIVSFSTTLPFGKCLTHLCYNILRTLKQSLEAQLQKTLQKQICTVFN